MQTDPGYERRIPPLFDDFTDLQLVGTAKEGDDTALEFLIDKYKNFVRIKARSYYLIGADKEDLIQEGAQNVH